MQHVDSDNNSSDYEAIFQDDFTDINRYSEVEASIAMEICGLNSSITELTDFICAAQMAKAADALLSRKLEKKLLNEDDQAVHLPNPMIGFGVLTEPDQITQRTLPDDAIGPLYFYYEKVALAPVGSAKLTERIRKALEAYDDELPSSVQNDAEVAFYCLSISLKIDMQELNDDRLEQLMSRFVEFDLVQSSEGHNGYHLDKENDRHRRSSNDVSRLEPASRYNQSAGSDLFMAL
ncbi:DEAD-box ATP-dependent RNA helicase 46 isoform 1 [Hibiscus syriacus]|uniref:DEAD-box ATP-dependent RNA helicase 46 isoform 1 n=1 Tax=Hibiscus syriacus TaxID=106335 RepID=A0A6A3CWU2_HIBSY|nr:DEAD-box ATP-dependent RNA helicase 46 isoform 1 [Hibiscus syriacus]